MTADVLPPARPSAASITDFDRAWPAVAARLQRLLAARGVNPEAADDICQEVACRVVSRGVRYESAEDLYPWAATVARRLSIDLHRTQRHLAPVEPPDRPDDVDVASLVEARARLRAVADAMPRLSAHDRAALTAVEAGPAATRKEAVRLAVRRHRARARLLAMVDAVGAVVAWAMARLAGRRLTKPAVVAAGAVGPMILLAWSFAPMPAGDPDETAPGLGRAPHHATAVAAAGGEPPRGVALAPASSSARDRVATGRPAAVPARPVPRLVVEPAVPGGPPVGRAALRPRTDADADACVTVGPVTSVCADVTDQLLDAVGR